MSSDLYHNKEMPGTHQPLMASIEVSLGWKRRREALLETLPRAARDLVRELDTLHQALKDKDGVIQSLKTQITNLGGTVGGGGEGGGALTDGERRTIQDRLNKVQQEMDAKKVAIKNLRLTLDKIDITDNIDVRIRAAELEYELEREELNILNLKEESTVLSARLHENAPASSQGSQGAKNSLHALLSSAGGGAALTGAALVCVSVPHTPSNPDFHVAHKAPFGCVIDWASEDTRLKKGDRLLEIGGECVVGRNLDHVTSLMSSASHLNLVVARPNTAGGGGRKSEGRMEKPLDDRSKELVSRLDKALKEKDVAKSNNTRLNHRISYLEDQVSELQSSLSRTREAAIKHGGEDAIVTTSQPGATVIQVFQKGDQKLAVASPEVGSNERVQEYPTLPRLRSPTSSSSMSSSPPSDPPSTVYQSCTISSRPSSAAENRRRFLSPRPDSKNEDSRPPSRTKPVPPKKPERLSLHRTTSLQSVEEGGPSAPHSTSQHNLHNWPSLDTDLHLRDSDIRDQTIYETGSERHYGKDQDYTYSRYQDRLHYRSREELQDRYSTGDGSVRMVVNGTPTSGERLSRRPSPQGAASAPLHEGHRSNSPDSSAHLDLEHPGRRDSEHNRRESDHPSRRDSDMFRTEIYSHSNSMSSPYSHHHHYHSHNHNQRHVTQHNHHHSAPTRPPNFTVATSPRPHEQWC